ncbi:MAG: DHH family phosphoesterase [Helicobacteraceae bacterium]|jgi:phosphoglycolate phosphatase|nr:DHH family phosphoesterase [Helicobacteraceae bacterium]
MTLKAIALYDETIVQCHDAPDPDTIACGFALWRYLTERGVRTRLVYSGAKKIEKPNVVLMVKLLNIPLEYVSELDRPKLLITVDCQYGAGNVTRFACDRFAVFDHHRLESAESDDLVIQPQLGSCSTLIWDLLRKEGFDFAANPNVTTALVYGLLTDTLEGAESRHPLDRDLAEFDGADHTIIKQLRNSALTIDELRIVANALSSSRQIGSIGLISAEECDPNLLGFASDVAKQVESFDCCVVYAPHNAGIKLSIRSCVRETMANELAVFITDEVGSGGGNQEKAGGYFSLRSINGGAPEDFIAKKIKEYQSRYDFIYANNHNIDLASFPRYRKLPILVGFVKTTDIFPEGAPICVRTLEGDVDTKTRKDIFLMIGVDGEIYPIERSNFEKSYDVLSDQYICRNEYEPTIINLRSGEKSSILPFAQSCLPKAQTIIRAAPLKKETKVFTRWDTEKYFMGRIGDYLAAPCDDPSDIYIIKRDIAHKTYEPLD